MAVSAAAPLRKDPFLAIGTAVYAVVFACLGALKYAVHRNLVDFGIFTQTVASAFGCFCNPIEGSHWAFHFSPILYVAAVALAIVHSPLTLIALQSIAGALTAIPVYAIVAPRLGSGAARLGALVVWLYPPLAGLTFGDFHENVFAPAAVAWTLAAFDARSFRWAALGVVLTLAIKEDQALFLAAAGAMAAYAYRDDAAKRRFALATVAFALAVAAIFFFAIQPHAAANPAWQPQRFYRWTAADVRALLPSGLLVRAGFLVLIFAPLAFLPFRSRAAWLAVPALLEVLCSRMTTTVTLGSHYAGAWIGYVAIAFAAGVCALADERRARRALLWALALCVVELLVANPLHPGLNLRAVQPRDAALDAALRQLPRGASVATQEEAYTHLALGDPLARLLPETPDVPEDACLVLVDRDFPASARLQEYGGALASLTARGLYVRSGSSGGIELYASTRPCR